MSFVTKDLERFKEVRVFRFFHSNIGASNIAFYICGLVPSLRLCGVCPASASWRQSSLIRPREVGSPPWPTCEQPGHTHEKRNWDKKWNFLKTFFLILLLLGAWISAVQGGTVNVSGVRRILKQSEVFLGISLLGSFRSSRSYFVRLSCLFSNASKSLNLHISLSGLSQVSLWPL